MFDEKKILERANQLYAEAKFARDEGWKEYCQDHPDFIPTIQSDQVKSLLKALVEALNS